MAFLFAENGIISRFLLHHAWGHYPTPDLDLTLSDFKDKDIKQMLKGLEARETPVELSRSL